MSRHLVLGSGPVGAAVAALLAARDEEVVIASRSGSGPHLPGVTRAAADATDPDVLGRLARGRTVIYNALNPTRYDRWSVEWPPMWAAATAAAQRSGALLATVGNLYGYDIPDRPIREDDPLRPRGTKGRLRVEMWREAERAHREGRFRAVEVRASDYLGPRAVSAASPALGQALGGRTARVIGRTDQPHSWTYPPDVAALVVVAAADPLAHGRVWHVPTNAPRTQRELVADVTRAAGVEPPRVRGTPSAVLRLAGLVDPRARAVLEVVDQFTHPFVIDDTAARRHFGLRPTPWTEVLAATVADLRTAHPTENGARP